MIVFAGNDGMLEQMEKTCKFSSTLFIYLMMANERIVRENVHDNH